MMIHVYMIYAKVCFSKYPSTFAVSRSIVLFNLVVYHASFVRFTSELQQTRTVCRCFSWSHAIVGFLADSHTADISRLFCIVLLLLILLVQVLQM